jgi:PEP-CTERM motif
VLATNVNHLSETFGPDVLMDPDKAFGEVIHDLSPLERGMYEDLFWSLTPVQAVPEPTSLWLVGAGLVGLLGYSWRAAAARDVESLASTARRGRAPSSCHPPPCAMLPFLPPGLEFAAGSPGRVHVYER